MWRASIKEYWNNQCAYCGSSDNLTLDHVHPKTKGGHDTTHNVVPACRSCNQSKGSNHWLSWWVGQDYFDLSNFSKVLSWTTS
ncbi:MAG: HNH endonuclease [Candidatus Nanopelagicaceae bacterium]